MWVPAITLESQRVASLRKAGDRRAHSGPERKPWLSQGPWVLPPGAGCWNQPCQLPRGGLFLLELELSPPCATSLLFPEEWLVSAECPPDTRGLNFWKFEPRLPSNWVGGHEEEWLVAWAAKLLINSYYPELLGYVWSSPTPASIAFHTCWLLPAN